MSGLSKADREIITQGNEAEKLRKTRNLFGTDLLGTTGGLLNLGSDTEPFKARGRSQSLKPLKRESFKEPFKKEDSKDSYKDIIPEEQEIPWTNSKQPNDEDNDFAGSRDQPTLSKLQLDKQTVLDWTSFEWKPHHSSFLRGVSNWSAYKDELLLQLECIGYEVGMTVTRIDELRIAAVIQRTAMDEPKSLISGIKSGTSMLRLLEQTYRQAGEIQIENLWETLLGLKYTGGCPISFVSRFKATARSYVSAGGELSGTQLATIFKQAVKAKALNWHHMVSSLARYRQWKIENLYQDFISSHYDRINKENNNRNVGAFSEGTLNNIQGGSSNQISESNKGNGGSNKKHIVRCYSCKKLGHIAKNCPKKQKKQNHNAHTTVKELTSEVGPPPALANEYCMLSRKHLQAQSYAAFMGDNSYDNLVCFYDNEIARRRSHKNELNQENDAKSIISPIPNIQFTQQILSVEGGRGISDRWLFDTGADVDATNKRQSFKPGTEVELRPSQFPIRTGNGIIHAESIGEIWLPLTGPGGKETVMRLKYVVYVKTFPLNIISGERFYRRGGRLKDNKIISPNGELLTYINAERRGFFLWVFNQPEPLKSMVPNSSVNVISASSSDHNELISSFVSDCSVDFRKEYQSCWIGNEFVMSDKVLTRLILWHRRLCHPSAERLKWTIKNTVGIDLNVSDVESLPCEACDMGKSLKFTTNERKTRLKNVGEGWHCDVGTLNPVSMEGHGYFCLTTDDASRYRIFCALKRKSDAAEELKSILARANSELKSKHNLRVKRVTIDGGRDWGLTSFQEFAKEQEIEVVVSAPNNQYQNGVSERGIRFVQDAARCCTIQMKVPSVFWNHMLEMVCYTLNCTSQSSNNEKKTPWEIYWALMDPDKCVTRVDHLWIPGTLCITHVDSNNRISGEKLDANGTRSVFLGYRGRKNKLVWLLNGGRFITSPHVVAYESVNDGVGWAADPYDCNPPLPSIRSRGRPKRIIQRPYEYQQMLTLLAPIEVDSELFEFLDEKYDVHASEKNALVDFLDVPTGRQFGKLECTAEDETKMNSFHLIRKAIDRQIYNFHSNGDDLFNELVNTPDLGSCLLANLEDEPSFNEAMKGPEKDEWIGAINVEIENCLSRGTFKFVPASTVKDRGRLVTSKWVLKKKYKSDMQLDKYKARVVARGFTQTEGVNYTNTSSTTARSASWRILMPLAAIKGWYILQADFISAYLAGDLKETIYMEQFQGLQDFFEERPNMAQQYHYKADSVIELKRPLYGLKQSGACWQEKVREIMEKFGFKYLISDSAIYFNRISGVIIASYVDDFLLIGPDKNYLQALTKELNDEVPLNDLGEANWFLGVRIQGSSSKGYLMLDQKQYLERSFQEFDISPTKQPKTPMALNSKEDMRKYSGKATASELFNYQKLVGKYNFSSCMVRCDTSQSTSLMARFMSNPSPQQMKHAIRIPQYLSTCPGTGLIYKRNHRHLKKFGDYGLHCAVDSSFADDFDTSKSTTGYVIFMAGSPVIWRSKLQTTVSTLTTESEFAAIFEATKDCAWIRSFLSELDLMPQGPIKILEDNSGAIKWATNDAMTSGRRHVRVEYHYVCQEVRDKNIEVQQIASKENPADGLTKVLTANLFQRFIGQLGLDDKISDKD